MLELTILVLSLCWIISFFDQSLIPHTRGFTDMLSVVIVLLILFRFLT